jgi:hypothetical protein
MNFGVIGPGNIGELDRAVLALFEQLMQVYGIRLESRTGHRYLLFPNWKEDYKARKPIDAQEHVIRI